MSAVEPTQETSTPINDLTDSELRQQAPRTLWRKFCAAYPPIPYPPELRDWDMTCGARTRRGTSCKRKDIYASGRCHLHGGPSTGPRTPEGKKRSAANGWCRKKPRNSS